jgi:hypothetical protein
MNARGGATSLTHIWVAVASVCLLAAHALLGQSAAPTTPSSAGQQAPPDRILYFVLFDHITKQDQIAAQQTAAGNDGNVFRNYYQAAIGLTAADFEILHDTALTCRASVAKQDDAAAMVIQDYRARAAAARGQGGPLPPIPSEIPTMQQQRDAMVLGSVAQLQQAMTPAGFQKLVAYVHQELSAHVRIQRPGALVKKKPAQ